MNIMSNNISPVLLIHACITGISYGYGSVLAIPHVYGTLYGITGGFIMAKIFGLRIGYPGHPQGEGEGAECMAHMMLYGGLGGLFYGIGKLLSSK